MKANDFLSLLSEIVALQLFYRRLNDVQLNDDVYNIIFKDVTTTDGKSEARIFLRNSKKDDYALTLRQLAGLRIATGPITAKWFDEFRDDANGATFQDKARELAEAGVSLDTVKFRVVAQLTVRNEFSPVANTPVYQDRCYVGSTEYSMKLRELVKGKGGDFYATPEYSLGVRELREKLHATALKPGKNIDANLVKLPVFEVI